MIKIQKTNPTARMLRDYVEANEFTFDNPRQRGDVWKRDKKSYLILSILEGYPIPPIYANRINGVYDILDGRQRCKAIIQFMQCKYKLSSTSNIILSDGEEVQLLGKTFADLPKEAQDIITGYNLDLHFGENLTEEQQQEIIVRLNSGKPMSAIELTKAKIKSVDVVSKLSNHVVFSQIMSEEARESSKNFGIIMQIYIILFSTDKCLLNSKVKQVLSVEEISSERSQIIFECMDIFNRIIINLQKDKSEMNKRVLGILKRKVHFVIIFSILHEALKKGISCELIIEWLKHFFDAPVGKTSISDYYNQNIRDAANSTIAVSSRLSAVHDDFESFLSLKLTQYNEEGK